MNLLKNTYQCALIIMFLTITCINVHAQEQETSKLLLFNGSQKTIPTHCTITTDPENADNKVALWKNTKKGRDLRITPANEDWSKFNTLSIRIHSSKANGQQLMITLTSDPKDMKGNYYYRKIKVDWTGWKTIVIPFKKMGTSRKPLGFESIQRLTFNCKGWGIEPLIDTVLHLDDVMAITVKKKVTKKPTPKVITQTPSRFMMPVNVGETVIAPLWNTGISQWDRWKEVNSNTTYQAFQTWYSSRIKWERPSNHGEIVALRRAFDIDLTDYDQLIIHGSITRGSLYQISLDTDQGPVIAQNSASDAEQYELIVPLNQAHHLNAITLSIHSNQSPPQSGSVDFKWIMLVNSAKLDIYLQSLSNYQNMEWGDYLATPDPTIKTIEPDTTLWATTEELAKVRKMLDALPEDENPFLKIRKNLHQYDNPEKLIRDYILVRDKRFTRQRDWASEFLLGRTYLADVALLYNDKQALALAGRTALSLASNQHWFEGMIGIIPPSSWDHRAFTQASVSYDLSYLLGMCGQSLTQHGKTYLLRRLAEQGINSVNYNSWRYEYIHHCNQLAAFSRGSIAAYLMLERSWPRAKPYTDLAMKQLTDSVNEIFFDDGGFGEGPAYFQYSLLSAIPPYRLFARARKTPIEQVLPKKILNTMDYIEAFMSTADQTELIPIGDGYGGAGGLNLSVALQLGAMIPHSQWVTMARNLINKRGGLNADLQMWINYATLPDKNPKVRPFVHIPSIGVMTSTRQIDDKTTKLLIHGSASKAGHSHEDTGSFVLEFAGQVFANDSDSLSYNNPNQALISQCQRHNMLVPISTNVRPAPRNPLNTHVDPVGHGNEKTFKATMQLKAGWEQWYKKWNRTWDSPSPDQLTITDEYELLQGNGVTFQWLTTLPVSILDNQTIHITGERGMIILTIPTDCDITIKDMIGRKNITYHRIDISKKQLAGTLQINIKLKKSQLNN